jgi:hypothetical protein
VSNVDCVIIHVSMFMSDVCPSIWHLSVSDRPGAAVVPGWNPISISLIMALGSKSLSL